MLPGIPDLIAVVLEVSLGGIRELLSVDPSVEEPNPEVVPLVVLVGLVDEDRGL